MAYTAPTTPMTATVPDRSAKRPTLNCDSRSSTSMSPVAPV